MHINSTENIKKMSKSKNKKQNFKISKRSFDFFTSGAKEYVRNLVLIEMFDEIDDTDYIDERFRVVQMIENALSMFIHVAQDNDDVLEKTLSKLEDSDAIDILYSVNAVICARMQLSQIIAESDSSATMIDESTDEYKNYLHCAAELLRIDEDCHLDDLDVTTATAH